MSSVDNKNKRGKALLIASGIALVASVGEVCLPSLQTKVF